jgi:hypothetical protein
MLEAASLGRVFEAQGPGWIECVGLHPFRIFAGHILNLDSSWEIVVVGDGLNFNIIIQLVDRLLILPTDKEGWI